MSNSYLAALIFIVLLNSCSSSQGNKYIREGKVIIAGKVISSENYSKSVTINYSGGSDRRNVRTVLIDATGIFQFEIDVLHPQDALLHYERGFVQLFISPFDSVFLMLDAHEFRNSRFPQLEISGSNTRVSEEIFAYNNFKTIKDFVPDIGDKSTKEYLNEIRKHILKEDSVLEAYCQNHDPSDIFRKWAKADNVYRNANYLIDFKIHHSISKTIYQGDLFNTDIFPVNNDEAIISSMYGYHLWHYANDKYMENDPAVLKFLEDENLYDAYRLCLLSIHDAENPGLSRDIMSYWALSSLFDRSFKAFVKLWDSDQEFIDDRTLAQKLQERKELSEAQNNYSIALLDPESKEEKEILGDFFYNLKLKHESKVIYLDIWATWCGPCRFEIPHAIELQEGFEDQPIVFVNLCLNSDKSEWLSALENLHIEGENYYFDKTQSALIRNSLRFKGFPTYMIIDKKGNIVSADAPRPSSDIKIKNELERYLNAN